jgi:hypothetical protein
MGARAAAAGLISLLRSCGIQQADAGIALRFLAAPIYCRLYAFGAMQESTTRNTLKTYLWNSGG